MSDIPDNFPVVGEDKRATFPWLQWMQRVQNVVNAVSGSGATADRPTRLLWVGRPFYDTTLGKPIWVATVNPVAWVDATGAAV